MFFIWNFFCIWVYWSFFLSITVWRLILFQSSWIHFELSRQNFMDFRVDKFEKSWALLKNLCLIRLCQTAKLSTNYKRPILLFILLLPCKSRLSVRLPFLLMWFKWLFLWVASCLCIRITHLFKLSLDEEISWNSYK